MWAVTGGMTPCRCMAEASSGGGDARPAWMAPMSATSMLMATVSAAIGRDVVDDVRAAHRSNARGPLALERQPAFHVRDGVRKDHLGHDEPPKDG